MNDYRIIQKSDNKRTYMLEEKTIKGWYPTKEKTINDVAQLIISGHKVFPAKRNGNSFVTGQHEIEIMFRQNSAVGWVKRSETHHKNKGGT